MLIPAVVLPEVRVSPPQQPHPKTDNQHRAGQGVTQKENNLIDGCQQVNQKVHHSAIGTSGPRRTPPQSQDMVPGPPSPQQTGATAGRGQETGAHHRIAAAVGDGGGGRPVLLIQGQQARLRPDGRAVVGVLEELAAHNGGSVRLQAVRGGTADGEEARSVKEGLHHRGGFGEILEYGNQEFLQKQGPNPPLPTALD
jgi:hypothetical protein